MKNPYIIGKRIYLRALLESDITDKYLSWINDYEVGRFLEANLFPHTKQKLFDYYKQIKKNKTNIIFAVVTKKAGVHIGNIKLGDINWIHRYAELGIMIGDKKYWGKGYGSEAVDLLLKYAFNRLNLNKIILGAYGNHKSALRTYKKAGFRTEGRIKNLLNFEGRCVDKIIMGISKKEYKKKTRL